MISRPDGPSVEIVKRIIDDSLAAEEHEARDRQSLEGNRYVYIWADGIYFNIRSDDARQCILVIIGVTEQGQKEFIAIEVGYRES